MTWHSISPAGETKAEEKKRIVSANARGPSILFVAGRGEADGSEGHVEERKEEDRAGVRFRARALLYLALPRSVVSLRFVFSFSRVSPREQETCTFRILLVVVFLLSAAAHLRVCFADVARKKTVCSPVAAPFPRYEIVDLRIARSNLFASSQIHLQRDISSICVNFNLSKDAKIRIKSLRSNDIYLTIIKRRRILK